MVRLACAAIALALFSSPVLAADSPDDSQGPWQIRLRAIAVLPDAHATVSPIGGNVRLNDSVVPEADLSYFLDDPLGARVDRGHHASSGQAYPSQNDLGSVWLLPPTLTAQYHTDPIAGLRPYVGAGVNYTIFLRRRRSARACIWAMPTASAWRSGGAWIFRRRQRLFFQPRHPRNCSSRLALTSITARSSQCRYQPLDSSARASGFASELRSTRRCPQ